VTEEEVFDCGHYLSGEGKKKGGSAREQYENHTRNAIQFLKGLKHSLSPATVRFQAAPGENVFKPKNVNVNTSNT